MSHNFALAIHGGAGTITRSMMDPIKEKLYTHGLEEALTAGRSILTQGGNAMDAVVAAVMALENNTLFNAGKGSVFNHLGEHEMDASLMDGSELKAGAVTCVKLIKNPILAARAVLLHSGHVLLSGAGAESFAKEQAIAFEPKEYFHDEFRYAQWQEIAGTESFQMDHTEKKFGTVGAVARDQFGNLAAATSTGGMTNKKWGRIGDTPIIGSGTYANNKTCAVSCTGNGEFFMRAVVAYDISCLMEYKGYSLYEACQIVVHDKLIKIGGEGGVIAVDSKGKVELSFNSEGMYRGWCTPDTLHTAIYEKSI